MLGILQSIWEMIQLIVQVFINLLSSLVLFIMMIPTYCAYILDMVAVIPDFASAFFVAGISLTIILFMMNRTE